MSETREFPVVVIASLSSGIMLCDRFSEIQEFAEYLMGHEIWTHHFADEKLCEEIRKTITKQCPGMPGPAAINTENWREWKIRLEADPFPTRTIHKGSGITAMSPTAGIPKHVESAIIDTSKQEEK